MMNSKSRISIIIPFYNEEKSLPVLLNQITESLDNHDLRLIFVNDGSTDESENILTSTFSTYSSNDSIHFKLVTLSRNFGQQAAIFAGLRHSDTDSDYYIVMDSDLQDDPRDIPKMLSALQEGYDCIYAERKPNTAHVVINRLTDLFYYLQNKISRISVPKYAGSFSAFSLNFKNELLEFGEKETYFPGLRAYTGYQQKAVPVTRRAREFEFSRYGVSGLIDLALNGILSFTNFPLRLIFLSGFIITATCIITGIILFWLRVFSFTTIPGVTTVLITIVGLFGVQFMFLGIVGEYLGKLFIESKSRPRYFVKDIKDFSC
jgi:glycosyltransferase involved in cell wall biosynthesis